MIDCFRISHLYYLAINIGKISYCAVNFIASIHHSMLYYFYWIVMFLSEHLGLIFGLYIHISMNLIGILESYLVLKLIYIWLVYLIGKTMVARILGKLLHTVGILPTDKVTEVQRTDLVGEFVGHTGPKTRRKVCYWLWNPSPITETKFFVLLNEFKLQTLPTDQGSRGGNSFCWWSL